jgi:SAM-dependent methyltransferase
MMSSASSAPRLYDELSEWFPLLSPPEEYAEEAELYRRVLTETLGSPPREVLELGSGAGSNASHMKAAFRMLLVDKSPGMLAVSRALNPDCEHVEGDMRNVRLGRQFDAVFVHDAVMYLTSESDLAAAMATAFVHCRPGGVVLFAPDYVRETFRAATDCGGSDGPDRGMRYMEWVTDPNPADTTFIVDYAYLLRESNGRVRVEHDRHVEGLFPRATWLRLLAAAGFDDVRVRPGDLSDLNPGQYELFVARKAG